MKFAIICVFVGLVFSVEAARILGVLHVPTMSHFSIGASVLYGLAEKGHDVTIVSPFPSKQKKPNVRDFYLEEVIEIGAASRKIWITMSNASLITTFVEFSNFSNSLADATLKSKAIQTLLKSGEKFDVVMVEPFGNHAFFGLANYFNAHLVIVTAGNTMFINELAGNPSPYSFVPNEMVPGSAKMTFCERFMNTINYLIYDMYYYIFVIPSQKKLYQEIFGNTPPFEETLKNGSLFLINSNVIFETPRPYLPSMIPIGGIHIKEPKKLPKDLQDYLDNAKEGAILFSLGSNLHSNELPLHKREAILKTLSKFPQKVLWKFEDEELPGKPDNVKIGKWLPQSDILAHPNVKLFITHGGLLSSTEAVYRGVPILGIPFYGDQHGNIAKFVKAGYGGILPFDELTEETFTEKLKEVLNNPSYYKNIKRHSEILKDNLEKPLDRAVFWVEHIIRHNGGRHLRSASLDLTFIEYFLLDVIGLAIFVLGIIIYSIYFVVKKVCCRRKVLTDKKKKPKRE